MKAGEIHILMHHYTRSYPYPEPSPFYRETIARFKAQDILTEDLQVTPKGKALVERLKAVEP